MKTSNWNVRFNAPKQEGGPDISLETELDALSRDEAALDKGAVPDSDPNRPL